MANSINEWETIKTPSLEDMDNEWETITTKQPSQVEQPTGIVDVEPKSVKDLIGLSEQAKKQTEVNYGKGALELGMPALLGFGGALAGAKYMPSIISKIPALSKILGKGPTLTKAKTLAKAKPLGAITGGALGTGAGEMGAEVVRGAWRPEHETTPTSIVKKGGIGLAEGAIGEGAGLLLGKGVKELTKIVQPKLANILANKPEEYSQRDIESLRKGKYVFKLDKDTPKKVDEGFVQLSNEIKGNTKGESKIVSSLIERKNTLGKEIEEIKKNLLKESKKDGNLLLREAEDDTLDFNDPLYIKGVKEPIEGITKTKNMLVKGINKTKQGGIETLKPSETKYINKVTDDLSSTHEAFNKGSLDSGIEKLLGIKYKINNEVTYKPGKFNTATTARDNILKGVVKNINNTLYKLSPELARVNNTYSKLSRAIEDPDIANILTKEKTLTKALKNYNLEGHDAVSESLEVLDALLPKGNKFLDRTKDLQTRKAFEGITGTKGSSLAGLTPADILRLVGKGVTTTLDPAIGGTASVLGMPMIQRMLLQGTQQAPRYGAGTASGTILNRMLNEEEGNR